MTRAACRLGSLAAFALLASVPCACGPKPAPITLTAEWPDPDHLAYSYPSEALGWTRSGVIRGQYQEVLDLSATFKAPAWRAAHAAREVKQRGLVGEQRAQALAQAQADMAGPLEVELLVTTWDRRENDLDRGKKSVWRVVLIDEDGQEIEPLEIVRDRRPAFVVRAEFPALSDFATPYIARFPRTRPIFGPSAKHVRLRMSSTRGGLEVDWTSG